MPASGQPLRRQRAVSGCRRSHALPPHPEEGRKSEQMGPGPTWSSHVAGDSRCRRGLAALGGRDAACVARPTETGTGDPEEDKAPLSEIIERLTERFGTNFTEQDRSLFEQVTERAVWDEKVRETERAKLLDVFRLGVWDQISKLMVDRMSENDALVGQ